MQLILYTVPDCGRSTFSWTFGRGNKLFTVLNGLKATLICCGFGGGGGGSFGGDSFLNLFHCERLQKDQDLAERTNMSISNIMRLLDFLLNHNYFKHDNTHYKQICPMGSPISLVIAELVIEEFEETAIATAPHPPKLWFRYVDDSRTCLKKDQVDEFHQHLNSINPSIQFTIELEDTKGQGLPFLDTIAKRRGTQLEVNVYRKPTHTGRYLDFNSHHPMCHI